MSVPNQKTIIIHQSDQIPFLKIGIEELMDAYKTIKTPSSFVLYLYLASNKDGYKLELSKEAFANATGYSKSSYHRAVDHLTKLGYIYEDNCGRLNFGTKPKEGSRKAIQNWEEDSPKLGHPIVKSETAESQNCNAPIPEVNTEIDNRKNKEKQIIIDNSSPKDYSYLDNVVGEDGSFSWEGIHGFVDGNDDLIFYDRPKEYQAKKMLKTTPFDEGEIQYILNNIIN